MKLYRYLLAALLYALPTAAIAQCSGPFAAGEFCGNPAATSNVAKRAAPTQMFDRAFGSTTNSIIQRTTGGWVATTSPIISGVRTFATYAAAQAATVGSSTTTIILENYYSGIRSGYGVWTKNATPHAVALATITTADGFNFIYQPFEDVEVLALGAATDGLSDQKAVFDAAIAFAAGRRIHVPVGIYRFDSSLASTTNIVHLACDGHSQATSPAVSVPAQASTLRLNFNGSYLFTLDNGGWNTFTGCMFESAAAQRPQTGGGAITATSSTAGVGIGLTIRDNAFSYLYDGVAMNKPSNPTIEGNVFNSHYRSALRYTTSGTLEGGIGSVYNNIFTAYTNTPANVIYSEIGYGKIFKNYIVGGNTGIDLFVQSGYSAGAVEITDNQIEEQINYGVRLRSNGGTIAMAQVTGNQFSNITNVGAGFVAHVAVSNFNGATVWAKTTKIERNILRSTLGAAGRYIYVQSGSNTDIIGNKIEHFGSASTVAIDVNGAELAAPITVHSNTYEGTLVKDSLAALVNKFNIRSLGYYNLKIENSDTLATANRTLTFHTFDADRAIGLAGNITTNGNLNLPAVAQGDLWYGSASGITSALAKDANATRYLSNQGTSNNPSWNQVNLANGVTGTLAAGNGGTGITSLGTGIATALGVNVGSAGAPVLFNGVLGSPSSVGTLPAHTLGGTVSGGGNQINNVVIGATTPLAATFTGITFSPTTGGIVGTTTNDDAGAGKVGEFIQSEVPVASEVTLTTGVAANITSIPLTAGDWDVWGNSVYDLDATTTVSFQILGISTTSATQPTAPNGGGYGVAIIPNNRTYLPIFVQKRLSLSAATTVYLVTTMSFATSFAKAYGSIQARRRR
jgi:hypothetical protein